MAMSTSPLLRQYHYSNRKENTMKKSFLISVAIALAFAAPLAWSHGDEKHEPTATVTAGRDTSGATIDMAAQAAEAVATVERFSAALGVGDLEKAAAELDSRVLILESGGVERSRDEYMNGHAKNDANFLKAAQITLKHRTAQTSGSLAWVSSESSIHAMKDDQMLMIDSTETMVVQKTGGAWKIVHIHWSSRRADAKH
jgi:hypothetical protein